MKSTCSLFVQIHRKLENVFVRPCPSPTLALLLSSCKLQTRSSRLSWWHAASTRGQSVLHDLPLKSTFRLMDSLVPNGRKIVNSKQLQKDWKTNAFVHKCTSHTVFHDNYVWATYQAQSHYSWIGYNSDEQGLQFFCFDCFVFLTDIINVEWCWRW